VINTHYHGDHSGGNAKLQALGARAVSSEKARERMVSNKQPGLSDLTFDQRMHLRIGGKQVDIYAVGRAHTDGDIVVLFPQHRVLAAAARRNGLRRSTRRWRSRSIARSPGTAWWRRTRT
jgi:glyoxylase-like metal-dependent hydrolase (beta-lactamase superfamily II)